MPEIDVMLFDLAHLFLLFQKGSISSKQALLDYEENNQICMAQIRLNLFSEEEKTSKAYV